MKTLVPTACSLVLSLLAYGTLRAQDAPEGDPEPAGAEAERSDGPILEMAGVERLRIGGEYRLRYEERFNYDFDDDASTADDFFVQRLRLDFDIRFDEDLGAFVQLQDVRYFGENQSPIERQSQGFSVHQGYVEIGDMPAVDGEMRVGRQILAYGDERVIGQLNWLSEARAFDGFRHRWTPRDDWNVDVFGTQIDEDISTTMRHDDAWFAGVYAAQRAEDGSHEFDAYLLHLYDELTPAGGNENRSTFGLRNVHRVGALEAGLEAVTQAGEIDGADIPIFETFGVTGRVKLQFEGDWKPYVRGLFDVASGDDPDTADNERFNELFPTGHGPLGIMDFAFWQNLVHYQVGAGVRPTERSRVSLDWHLFRAFDEGDEVFGPQGRLTDGGAGFSRDLGQEVDLIVHTDLGDEDLPAFLEAGYGIFFPGDGVQDSFGSDDLAHFVYAQGGLRF